MKLIYLIFIAALASAQNYVNGSRVQQGPTNACTAVGGTGNAITCTLADLPSLTAQVRITFIAAAANTGAATLALNGGSALAIKKAGGSADLAANDIRAGQIVEVGYTGTLYHLISAGGNASAGGGGSCGAGFGILVTGGCTISVDTSAVPTFLTTSGNLNFGSIAANACAELTLTVPGAATGDAIAPQWPSTLESGLLGIMTVTATNTVTVRLCKITTGSVDPADQAFRATIVRSF